MSESLHAQASYQPIFTPKTRWELYHLDANFKGNSQQQATLKDTIINANQYMVFVEEGKKPVYIRENVAERKVYAFEDGKEFLLYDFNLVVGDKFYIKQWELEVVAVGSMKTAEGEKKCIELKPISKTWDNLKWVEGLGAMIAPLYYKYYDKLTDSYQVTCFFRDKDLIYSVNDWNCATPTATKNIDALNRSVQVSPNPFHQNFHLTVNNPSGEDVSIRISTITGVTIYEEKFDRPSERLETNLGWSNTIFDGILLLTVQTSEGSVTKRIIKE
jgi:hypothetical protein